MKLALPTNNGMVEGHFGQCANYTIVTIDADRKIEKIELIDSQQGCGCKSNIASVLRDQGVDTMLAGNMGEGALQVLSHHGIEVYRGCSGTVSEVVDAWLSGSITDSGVGCAHHHHHNHH